PRLLAAPAVQPCRAGGAAAPVPAFTSACAAGRAHTGGWRRQGGGGDGTGGGGTLARAAGGPGRDPLWPWRAVPADRGAGGSPSSAGWAQRAGRTAHAGRGGIAGRR